MPPRRKPSIPVSSVPSRPKRDGIAEILRAGRFNFSTSSSGYSDRAKIPLGLRTPAQAERLEAAGNASWEAARKHEHEQRRAGGSRSMHHKGQMAFDEFVVANREYGRGWHRDKKTRAEILKRTGRAF